MKSVGLMLAGKVVFGVMLRGMFHIPRLCFCGFYSFMFGFDAIFGS